jgi:hypothetical protein
MLIFNGVDVSGGHVQLLKAPHSYSFGTHMLLLRELQNLLLLMPAQKLDCVFSYNAKVIGTEEAIISPQYAPKEFANTYCGALFRTADDGLKLLLAEITSIFQTEALLNILCQDKANTNFILKGGVSRLRLKPGEIVAARTETRLIVRDVTLKLEFDTELQPVSTCALEYIKYLETTWIRTAARDQTHPFYKMKQVVTAQAIMNFLVEKNLWLAIKPYRPGAVSDPCTDIVFKSKEFKSKIWTCEQKQDTSVLVVFEKQFKDSNINVMITRFANGQQRLKLIPNPSNEIARMTYRGEMISNDPSCPTGGIVSPHNWTLLQTTNNAILEAMAKPLPPFRTPHGGGSSGRDDKLENRRAIGDLPQTTLFSAQFVRKHPDHNAVPSIVHSVPTMSSTPFEFAIENRGVIGFVAHTPQLPATATTYRGDSRGMTQFLAEGGLHAKGNDMNLLRHLNQNNPKSGIIATSTSLDQARRFPAGQKGSVLQLRMGVDKLINMESVPGNLYPQQLERGVKHHIPVHAIEGEYKVANRKVQLDSFTPNPHFNPQATEKALASGLHFTGTVLTLSAVTYDGVRLHKEHEKAKITGDFGPFCELATGISGGWQASILLGRIGFEIGTKIGASGGAIGILVGGAIGAAIGGGLGYFIGETSLVWLYRITH